MRRITIYLEDADGETDQVTGMHVDHGDGTATWLRGGDLDGHTPAGSPRSLRGILRRLRDDAKPLPKVQPRERVVAPKPTRDDDGELVVQ